MSTKKAKDQIQEPSHEEIKVAVQIYLKNGGKIQRLEMERASTDLNMVLERGWQKFSITTTNINPKLSFDLIQELGWSEKIHEILNDY